MNHINRLLAKAKRVTLGNGVRYAMAFINYDKHTNKYIADPRLWGGIEGSGFNDINMPEWWHTEYDTEDAACEALVKLFSSFGVPEDECLFFHMHYV